jgi:sporulation protein YlmC with PRC-barrel domain
MRLSDYLGREVVDADGQRLGRVHDAELVADGPAAGDGRALRLHALLVGFGSLGARLGLDRPEMRGPWLLKLVFARRKLRRIPWEDIESVTDETVRLRARADGPDRIRPGAP